MNPLYDELVHIVRVAPGAAAPHAVLHVLTTLATDRNPDAALALGRIVWEELDRGAGERVWPDAALDSLRAAELPALTRLVVLGYADPISFTNREDTAEMAAEADRAGAYARLQELVRRDAPTKDVVLTALVLAEFVEYLAFDREVLGGAMSGSGRLRMLRDITATTGIVPGDSVDTTFSVGRDFVLGTTSFDGFSFAIKHELGHHLSDHSQSGQRDTLDAGEAGALVDAVWRVLGEAAAQLGQPLRPSDPRVARLPSGLQVICTVDTAQTGVFTHFSLSQAGGPLDHDHAVACVCLIVETLRAAPDTAVIAYSPAGRCHLAVPDVPRPPRLWSRRAPDLTGLSARAEAWFAELARSGRIGRDERDITRVLGAGGERVDFYPSTPDAMRDLTICARLRSGELAATDDDALLRTAVACADPVALRMVLAGAAGPDRTGPAGLARLGASRCLVVDDEVVHTGSSAADVRTVLTVLDDAGFDIDEPVTETGGTLLSDAAVRDAELTAFLIATGSDVHRRGHHGATALAEAARCANWQAVTVLAGAGARLDERDDEGRTALHHAVMSGSTETVARVIAGGAAVTATDAGGVTPLAHAGTTQMITMLCRAGADPNAADHTGRTPLLNAAARGQAEVVGALLREGGDPNTVTDTGESALHHAAIAADHRVDVVTMLLDAGANPDEETDEGMTPLMAAAMDVHDDAVALLLERGADPNARTVRGYTALMHASDGRNEWTRDFTHNDRMMACMRLLVAAGADVDAADDNGWTALHYACLGFDAGPIEQLLALGANPNVVTEDGVTPLGQATAKAHQKMIEDLTKAGAREEQA